MLLADSVEHDSGQTWQCWSAEEEKKPKQNDRYVKWIQEGDRDCCAGAEDWYSYCWVEGVFTIVASKVCCEISTDNYSKDWSSYTDNSEAHKDYFFILLQNCDKIIRDPILNACYNKVKSCKPQTQ